MLCACMYRRSQNFGNARGPAPLRRGRGWPRNAYTTQSSTCYHRPTKFHHSSAVLGVLKILKTLGPTPLRWVECRPPRNMLLSNYVSPCQFQSFYVYRSNIRVYNYGKPPNYWTLASSLWSHSIKVVGTDADRSATLLIHSNHGSRTVSEINGDFGRKWQIFLTPCI